MKIVKIEDHRDMHGHLGTYDHRCNVCREAHRRLMQAFHAAKTTPRPNGCPNHPDRAKFPGYTLCTECLLG